MKDKLNSLLLEAKNEINNATSETDMNVIKSKYLGKSSELTNIMKEMSTLTQEEK